MKKNIRRNAISNSPDIGCSLGEELSQPVETAVKILRERLPGKNRMRRNNHGRQSRPCRLPVPIRPCRPPIPIPSFLHGHTYLYPRSPYSSPYPSSYRYSYPPFRPSPNPRHCSPRPSTHYFQAHHRLPSPHSLPLCPSPNNPGPRPLRTPKFSLGPHQLEHIPHTPENTSMPLHFQNPAVQHSSVISFTTETQLPKSPVHQISKPPETQIPKSLELQKSPELLVPKSPEHHIPNSPETMIPKSPELHIPNSPELQTPKSPVTQIPKSKKPRIQRKKDRSHSPNPPIIDLSMEDQPGDDTSDLQNSHKRDMEREHSDKEEDKESYKEPPMKRKRGRPKKIATSIASSSKILDTIAKPLPDRRALLTEIVIYETQGACDASLVSKILDLLYDGKGVHWCSIAGLKQVKQHLSEMVVWPLSNPALFKGLRKPPKGLLLYGPPGNGKTMIGQCIATEARAKFFNLTASSLGSKWFGEAEGLARTLFDCARALAPSIIFIDEVDSLLSKRRDNDGGCSTRLKSEMLSQMSGCGKDDDKKIVLVVGATNYPEKIDEAARRRFTKRLYIPLPDADGRKELVQNLLQGEQHSLGEKDFELVAEITDGYSGADMKLVCENAALEPIREVGHSANYITPEEIREITIEDFVNAVKKNPPTVNQTDLEKYIKFNDYFGSK